MKEKPAARDVGAKVFFAFSAIGYGVSEKDMI